MNIGPNRRCITQMNHAKALRDPAGSAVIGRNAIAIWSICLLATLFTGVGKVDADQLTSGTSSRSARKLAIESIPYQQLNQATLSKIKPILDRPSIYRRLPITAIDVDPDYFVFLVRYPEVVVNIWKLMGVTQMVSERTGPFTMATDDGAGTISNVELVYGTKNMHIFFGDGSYEGPVLRKKLKGKCVLVLRSDYRMENGKQVATSQLDVFLKVENATANLVAKTVNPIVGKTADHNFVESLKFIQRLNETTVKNGPGVQHMAGRLQDLNGEVRQEFVRLAGEVYREQTGLPVASLNPGVNAQQRDPRQSTAQVHPASYRQVDSYRQSHPSNYSSAQPTQQRPMQQQPMQQQPMRGTQRIPRPASGVNGPYRPMSHLGAPMERNQVVPAVVAGDGSGWESHASGVTTLSDRMQNSQTQVEPAPFRQLRSNEAEGLETSRRKIPKSKVVSVMDRALGGMSSVLQRPVTVDMPSSEPTKTMVPTVDTGSASQLPPIVRMADASAARPSIIGNPQRKSPNLEYGSVPEFRTPDFKRRPRSMSELRGYQPPEYRSRVINVR